MGSNYEGWVRDILYNSWFVVGCIMIHAWCPISCVLFTVRHHNIYIFISTTSTGIVSYGRRAGSQRIRLSGLLSEGPMGKLVANLNLPLYLWHTFMAFCFVSLTSFLFAAKFTLFFLNRTSHPSIYHCLIFKIDRVTLWPFLLSLILLPNRHFQRKHQLLVPTSCCSFYTSHFRLAWISSSLWDCLLCSPNEQSDDCEMWENVDLALSGSWPITIESRRVVIWKERFIRVVRYGWEMSGQWRVGWYWRGDVSIIVWGRLW